MPQLHLDWFKCAHGYRIEDVPHRPEGKIIAFGGGGGLFVVPNSDRWYPTEPLKFPALYRTFAKRDADAAGLLDFVNLHGFLLDPRTTEGELVDDGIAYIRGMQTLVAAIDRGDWDVVIDGLNSAGKGGAIPRPGIGRLGIIFETVKDEPRPRLKFRPPTLIDGLQSQALVDAAYGIEHRECKNPECREYFPVSGTGAYRADAEYHSEKCRLRHAYLKRKEGAQ